jgi:ketosteroid isomerase-like protein
MKRLDLRSLPPDVSYVLGDRQSAMLAKIDAGDHKATADYYDNDAIIHGIDTEPICGKSSILACWEDICCSQRAKFEFEPTTVDISAEGDLVFERGRYKTFRGDGSKEVVDHGEFAVVWKRTGDDWKIMADVVESAHVA